MGKMNIEFVIDEFGNKKAVLIPFQEWEQFKKEVQAFFECKEQKESLKKAFIEVEKIKKGELPKRTMQQFLDEC